MQRVGLVVLFLLAGSAPAFSQRAPKQAPAGFSVVEATIPEMRAAMERGRTTSREIVLQSLVRIALYEDKLNAVITVNANALQEAEERDRERAQGRVGGRCTGSQSRSRTTSTRWTCPERSGLRDEPVRSAARPARGDG